MKTLDWYFDFISPFAYLQSAQLDRLPADVEVCYKPVLFAGLLQHWDNKGPGEIDPKRLWTFEYCVWLAHQQGIPMKLPAHHPYNPLPLLRLCIALGPSQELVQRLFQFVWRDGHLPTDQEPWESLLDELYATPDMLTTDEVKQTLRQHGEQAIAAGVFGVPTSVVDGRCFWGQDALPMLLAYLDDDPFFQSDAIAAARNFPHGVHRAQIKS